MSSRYRNRGQPKAIISRRGSVHGGFGGIQFIVAAAGDFGRTGRTASLRNHHRFVVAAGRTFQANSRPSSSSGVLRSGRSQEALKLCPLFPLLPLVVLLDSIRHSVQTQEDLAFATDSSTESGHAIGQKSKFVRRRQIFETLPQLGRRTIAGIGGTGRLTF